MPRLSFAKQLFDGIVAGGPQFIQNMETERKHETEYLDFKAGNVTPDEKLKAIWSKTICGFANNQGGVLVWGLDARDDGSGVDAVRALDPVTNPAQLRSRLLILLKDAVEPPLAGVDVHDMRLSDGSGFVACFIPESDNKPHRACFLPGKPYIMRFGESFMDASPSTLRSLFFPRSSPRLWVEVIPQWNEAAKGIRDYFEICYRVRIGNEGFVSAKEVFAVVTTFPKAHEIKVQNGVTKTPVDEGTGIELGHTLHPSARRELCSIYRRCGSAHTIPGLGRYEEFPHDESFQIEFRLFADDMPPAVITVKFGELEIRGKHTLTGRPAFA